MATVINPQARRKGETPQAPAAQNTKAEKQAKSPDFPVADLGPRSAEARTDSLTLHPILEAFPPMSEAEFARLKASIADEGILLPLLITPAMQLLDGKGRWMAALALGLPTVPVKVVEKTEPLALAMATTLDRRQLTESGRALLIWLKHPELACDVAERKLKALAKGLKRGETDAVSFRSIAERYSVKRDYLADLVVIKNALNPKRWKAVQAELLSGEKSIPQAKVGALGSQVTKGGVSDAFKLAEKSLAVDVVTRLSRWPTFSKSEKEAALNLFCDVLTKIPPQFLEAVEERLPELLTKRKGGE